MLDLYSGLGGASEAFVKAGWDVMRCENNPLLMEVPETWNWDLSDEGEVLKLINMPFWDNADLIWASPPCRDFSNAYAAPGPTARREGRDFEPDLTLLKAAVTIIEEKNPRFWVIENVFGASKIFSEILGMKPRRAIGSFLLWGNFPEIIIDPGWKHNKETSRKTGVKGTDTWSSDPLRANKKAKIPYQISWKLLQAIEQQRTMEDFCA